MLIKALKTFLKIYYFKYAIYNSRIRNRRCKQMDSIEEDDITERRSILDSSVCFSNPVLWEDKDVCILHPNAVGRGIVVYHIFPKEYSPSIAEKGLVLGAGITINHNRSVEYPYHFFRAPAKLECNPVPSIPSLQSINANYASNNAVNASNTHKGFFCIRIDPAKTSVYSSECRVAFWGTGRWKASRKTLTEYIGVLERNSLARQLHRDLNPRNYGYDMFNVFTNEIAFADILQNEATKQDCIMTNAPPEYNSEILVALKVIPSHWQVKF